MRFEETSIPMFAISSDNTDFKKKGDLIKGKALSLDIYIVIMDAYQHASPAFKTIS